MTIRPRRMNPIVNLWPLLRQHSRNGKKVLLMFRPTILVLAASLMPPAAVAAPAQSPMAKRAQSIISARMLDPDSLQLRSTKVVTAQVNGETQRVLCGEYNAKNKFGGYVGFRGFAYEPTDLKGVLTFDNSLKVGFFSEADGGDLDPDPRAAVMAGVSAEVLSARSKRYYSLAETYIPICLGLTE